MTGVRNGIAVLIRCVQRNLDHFASNMIEKNKILSVVVDTVFEITKLISSH